MVALMADRQKSSKASGTVKKVTSPPSIRTVADHENGEISPSDKKRNKLGYHRTAVACGHCRRRKIRCIPSADPNSSRCQNCIRLKKECHFFPVDQGGATTQPKRPRADSKGDALTTETDTSVSSSSPKIHAVPPAMDTFDHFRSQIEPNQMSQGSEQDHFPNHEHRSWYPVDQSYPHWISPDGNQNSSLSPYPITPVTAGQPPVTSQGHAFTYPAPTLEHADYPYSAQRSREGPVPTQPGVIPAFGGYRANTMPERFAAPDDAHRSHDMTQSHMNLQSQHMMGGPFQQIHYSSPNYGPPPTHPVWVPSTGEQHHPISNYIHPGATSAWYNHTDGLNGVRDGNASHSHGHDAPSQDGGRFRPKPG